MNYFGSFFLPLSFFRRNCQALQGCSVDREMTTELEGMFEVQQHSTWLLSICHFSGMMQFTQRDGLWPELSFSGRSFLQGQGSHPVSQFHNFAYLYGIYSSLSNGYHGDLDK